MDIVTVAMGLAQFAPAVIRWITGSKNAEKVAAEVRALGRKAWALC